MKQKHTNSRKARLASMFHTMGTVGMPSKVRVAKRDALFGRKTPKTFGEQIKFSEFSSGAISSETRFSRR